MGTYIEKLSIQNFRIFDNITFNLFEKETILIGKNNIGKTTFYKAIDVLDRKRLCYEDINANFLNSIFNAIQNEEEYAVLENEKIGYEASVRYDNNSNHVQFRDLLTKCDLEGNFKVSIHYHLTEKSYNELANRVRNYSDEKEIRLQLFMEVLISYLVCESSEKRLSDILYFGIVSASRMVDTEFRKESSRQTLDVFSHLGQAVRENQEIRRSSFNNINQINRALENDTSMREFISELREFTFPNDIAQNYMLRHNEYDPFKNVRPMLVHKHNDVLYIPDHYNGLGYTNFYKIFIEIANIIDKVIKNKHREFILIIEEPEAFTHPQMQYVFIRKIYEYIEKKLESANASVQLIVISHSPHIVSQVDPENVVLLTRGLNRIKTTPIMESVINGGDQNSELIEEQKFMKQYLTVINSEILFADKIICVEGDTELMLIKKFMHIIDTRDTSGTMPLLAQNISIITVGTYFKKFKKFIELINLDKVLIITDVDYICDASKKSSFEDAVGTSNDNINELLISNEGFTVNNVKDLPKYSNVDGKQTYYNKYLDRGYKEVTSDITKSYISVAHQNIVDVSDDGVTEKYCPRSFEDSFVAANYTNFPEQIKIKKRDYNLDFVNLRELWKLEPQSKKSDFAFEILTLNDTINIPQYIEEGLKWLR